MANLFNDLTVSSTSPLTNKGATRTVGTKDYVYVQLSSSALASTADGTVLCSTLSDENVVTDDISTTSANFVKGVAVGVIAAGSYGWIQTWGVHDEVLTNDDIATGDTVIAGGDGICDSVAEGTASTYKPLGIANEADVASDTVSVFLQVSRAGEQ